MKQMGQNWLVGFFLVLKFLNILNPKLIQISSVRNIREFRVLYVYYTDFMCIIWIFNMHAFKQIIRNLHDFLELIEMAISSRT